ncbi:MAG: hypothetical protein P4L86_22225 [Mycobacterium sp.]|nr:hypothetical protein [Mycobacterium sp.]
MGRPDCAYGQYVCAPSSRQAIPEFCVVGGKLPRRHDDETAEPASAEALYETLVPVSYQAESAMMAFLLEPPRSAEGADAAERNLEALGEEHNGRRKAKGDSKK